MTSDYRQLYKFGAFHLDTEDRLLLRNGEVVPLAPKAFDVLLALVKQPGHLLEKEELLKTVWPDSFVEENNLADNISKLRKALGEGENGQKYIETIPRRGYRFIAEVRQTSEEISPLAENLAPAVTSAVKHIAAVPPHVFHYGLQKRWLAWFSLLAVSLLIVAGAWLYHTRQPVLTEKDTILLADFENKTGEEIFDEMLKQALAIQLQESPFLNLLPEAQMRHELTLMKHPANERVTTELARELCQRQNLKALIVGSLAPLGSHYVITLSVLNGQTGEALAREQVEAERKEQVLGALAQAAKRLRERLGEQLSSIQHYDYPLPESTTAKLEAFKTFALGQKLGFSGKDREAIPVIQHAVKIDPDFAHAWLLLAIIYSSQGQPEQAAEYMKKAYALKDQVGEYERLRILTWYDNFVTGERNKQLETLLLQKRLYPRDWVTTNDVAATYTALGQFEQALPEARESIRVNPLLAPAHGNLTVALLRLNRFAEAQDELAQALRQKLERTSFHAMLYQIAFINNDAAVMKQQLDWTQGKPDEYVALDWQASVAAFAGQWRAAQDFSRRAIDLAARSDNRELAARYATEQALRSAVLGNCQASKTTVAQGLSFGRGRLPLSRAALALALCGAAPQAQTLADELAKRFPEDTLSQEIWLPVLRATLSLHRGDTTQAIEQLRNTSRYEAAAEFWPQYLRGQAYLKLGQGAAAAAEFQKILDHRGEAPLSVLYPLARLGLARAAKLKGESAQAREAYAAFFILWQAADQDLLLWKEARQENLTIK